MGHGLLHDFSCSTDQGPWPQHGSQASTWSPTVTGPTDINLAPDCNRDSNMASRGSRDHMEIRVASDWWQLGPWNSFEEAQSRAWTFSIQTSCRCSELGPSCGWATHLGGRGCMHSRRQHTTPSALFSNVMFPHPPEPGSQACWRCHFTSTSAFLPQGHVLPSFPPHHCTFPHQSDIANCWVSHSRHFFAQTARMQILIARSHLSGSCGIFDHTV